MARKGFPESYDLRRLVQFMIDVKAGGGAVHAPVYSHQSYDIVPGRVSGRRSAGHPDRRRAQRAADERPAAGPARAARRVGLLRLLDLHRRRRVATSRRGTSRASSRCARRSSRIRARTFTATRRSTTGRPWRRRATSGGPSTASTCTRTSSRRASARGSCWKRARTTRSSGSGCGEVSRASASRRAWPRGGLQPRARPGAAPSVSSSSGGIWQRLPSRSIATNVRIREAGQLALAGERALRKHLHFDFERRVKRRRHRGAQDDEVADLDRVEELQPVHGRGDEQAARVAMRGDRAGDVDQVHRRCRPA